MKVIKSFVLFIMITLCASASVFAQMPGTDGWQEPYHVVGHEYIPRMGTFSEYIASGARYVSKVYFWLDQTNVDTIEEYNNGLHDLPTKCSTDFQDDGFFTVDVSAIPHTEEAQDERLSAILILTNLPNPVKDLEDDDSGGIKEESEVVALGTLIVNKQYYVKTYWRDNRDGTEAGVIGVNFGISHQSDNDGDYNDCFCKEWIFLGYCPPPAIVNDYSGQFGEL